MPNIKKEDKEKIFELYNKGLKKCSCCGEILPLSWFYPTRTVTNMLPFTRECARCKSEKAKIRYQKIKELEKLREERRRAK
jgi:hypothetical protein